MIAVRAVDDLSAVHLIGVGGAGMSALARVLAARGARVSGSDIKESRGLVALRALGVQAHVGHSAEHLQDASVVVVSSAIGEANPEVAAAQRLGIPILQRAQVLAMLMRDSRSIAVAGTHGKTTTTSMTAMALRKAGLDPTFLIGGDVNETGTNAHHGSGAWLVAEADESDGSFLWLAPEVAVITNVEADHLDHYRGIDEITEAFKAFAGNVVPHGTVIVCADDPGAAALLPFIERTVVTYGLGSGADWQAEVLERSAHGVRVRILHHGAEAGIATLGISGDHNVRNALAAMAAAHIAGVDPAVALAGLATFTGVARRFELRGVAAGVTVVDDYAHHPTELRATIAAARERGWRRIVAVYQPHRYSRTQAMAADMGAALAGADLAVVTDVYGAGELPLPGVTGKLVIDGLLDADPSSCVAYLPARSMVAAFVAERARPTDLVLTLGAGDVTMLAADILELLSQDS